MGAYYREAGYAGPVDVGLAVTGIEGGVTSRSTPMSMWDYPTYKAESFLRTDRVAAGELGEPEAVAGRLLRDLFDATTGREDFDPFA